MFKQISVSPCGNVTLNFSCKSETPFPQGVDPLPSPRVGRVSFAGIDRNEPLSSLPPEWEADADCSSAAAAKHAPKKPFAFSRVPGLPAAKILPIFSTCGDDEEQDEQTNMIAATLDKS